ncbi:MAG: tetratricopeptide repeat protein [Bacteroidota bacterium]
MFKKIVVFFSLILASCSQFSNKSTSVKWHNLNSKYNAYLQAKDNLKIAELALNKQYKDNYSEILPILIPLDSIAAKSVVTQLDAVIKKSSLIAEKHQNSKYLGDSYNLIGIARLYKGDFINAIETFKFVNSEATKEDQKHEAMVHLMRAYLESGDEGTALRVAEILKEQPLNKKNQRDFYLTKAQTHQLKKEYQLSTAILEEALPLMKKGEQKARVHFAAGQMYEKLNDTRNASTHYRAVLKNNPAYDLAFYADLNRMMFSPGSSMQQTFSKLSKDRKNIDLLDKLYYSMALVEEKNGNLDKAIEHLQKAVKATGQGNQNVANAFLKLGDINYYRLQNYENSKAYYDSALVLLPPNSKEFEKIADRKRALDDFALQKNVIKTEDSLQKMATMNAEDLDVFLNESIKRNLDKEKKDIEAAKKANQAKIIPKSSIAGGDPNSVWYLYNENALMAGRIEFTQKWGQRKLEDNWRRATKSSFNFDNNTPSANSDSVSIAEVESDENKIENLKKEIITKIPKTEKDLQTSRLKEEEALFNLGKIYKLYLLENQNSIESFEKLLSLNPKSEYAAEAIYYLALLNEGNSKQDYWKAELERNYPTSFFARKISRGNENLSTDEQNRAKKAYELAYQNYENGKFSEAMNLVNESLKTYPGSQLEDRFAFLKLLLYSKLQSKDNYIIALDEFLLSYSKSNLLPLAKEMKNALNPKVEEEKKF